VSRLQVANRWFERKMLSDQITWLWEPHVHPFLRCNIWHVRGRDRDLIVDTGLGLASVRDELASMLDKPVIAVATHVHYDHVGCLHEFETRVMHRIEAPLMDPYEDFAELIAGRFPADALKEYAESGYVIDDGPLITAIPHASFDPETFMITPTRPTWEVDEGDVIDLGDRSFEVLHLPGHSPGSIGLWERESGTLFSGDSIYDGPLLDELPGSDIAVYLKTMKRLREIPVNVVHGGHDASFGRDRLVELADAYLKRRGS